MEIVGIFVFLVSFVLTFVTASLARRKGRSGFRWFIIACFITPYLAMIVLACLGETEDKRMKRILEEEEFKRRIEHKYAKSDDSRPFNPSAKTINDMYRK